MGGVEKIGDKKQTSILYSTCNHIPELPCHHQAGLGLAFQRRGPELEEYDPSARTKREPRDLAAALQGRDQGPVSCHQDGLPILHPVAEADEGNAFCVWYVSNEFMRSPAGTMEARAIKKKLCKSRNDPPCGR